MIDIIVLAIVNNNIVWEALTTKFYEAFFNWQYNVQVFLIIGFTGKLMMFYW